MKVNILGTPYTLREETEKDRAKMENANGFCESYSKEIVIRKIEATEYTFDALEEFRKKVVRHEIIHAFLHESGLANNSDWAVNEELVDWFALQFPKLTKAFEDAKCL